MVGVMPLARASVARPSAVRSPAASGVPPLATLKPPAGEQADRLGDIEGTGRLIAESGLN